MLTARARAVEIDRTGIIIVLGVSGGGNQGGRIRHEKWGKVRVSSSFFSELSFSEVKLDTCQVNSLSTHIQCYALESSYAGSRQASMFTSECDSRHTFQTGLEVRSYSKQQILSKRGSL